MPTIDFERFFDLSSDLLCILGEEGRLVRADGFPPHRDRFEATGGDLAALLAQGS